ncbi:MAG: molecular chaperone HtpG [Lentimicrobiaceae bacterium]|nr:molecular chaperone HtpG [Lentimicrobiaceae bacterium]
MIQGQINVQTENIFPIIKKFLYSDEEIFLRELISNAVDATTKLKALASMGKYKEELGDLTIEVKIDKENKTITVSDKGIGMTSEEVDKYINEIAFSGAEEFVKKYKNKTEAEQAGLIGHFGLGFYSSFMVSDKVEIISKTYKKGAGSKAVRWSCDSSPNYTMEEHDKKERGTDIILHISKDSEEYLEENRILTLLNKYCKFLPIPIRFGNEKVWEESETEKDEKGNPKTVEVERPRIINDTNPLWIQTPSTLKHEDYIKFYRQLYPMTFDEPLFYIHLNVDYPFDLTGILYFPKVNRNIDLQRNKIQLFCNQVFVTDSVEGIVPDFLTLLHGVIDSPDIPLNVSRSYLQSDANVKKISGHIMKKVADKLEELYKSEREDFEKKWDDIKLFITYGMISEEKFFERAEKFALLKNTEGKYFTFDQYKDKVKDTQKDKNDNTVIIYASNVEEQHSYINAAKERGYDIVIMDGLLDSHFINTLEQKLEKVNFVRVDSEITDKLIDKDEKAPSKLSDDEKKKLSELFEKHVNKEQYNVQVEDMSETDFPVTITQSEFMRRMKDMAEVGGGGYGFMGNMPDMYNIVVNANHNIISKILADKNTETQTQKVLQLIDLALLSQNLLKGENLTAFLNRSIEII